MSDRDEAMPTPIQEAIDRAKLVLSEHEWCDEVEEVGYEGPACSSCLVAQGDFHLSDCQWQLADEAVDSLAGMIAALTADAQRWRNYVRSHAPDTFTGERLDLGVRGDAAAGEGQDG